MKCSFKIKDKIKNRVVAKFRQLIIKKGIYRKPFYFMDIEMKDVMFKERDEINVNTLEAFSIIIINYKNEPIGEYDADVYKQSIEIKTDITGRKDIVCRVRMEEKLTSSILQLWGLWNESLKKNLWGEWSVNKKRQWIKVCFNHQKVRENYYEDSIYYRSKRNRIYLDGTYIIDEASFFCAMGEAFFGAGGFYGGENNLGYAYFHDQIALEKYPMICWENFRLSEGVFLLYFMHLAVNEAGAKLVVGNNNQDGLCNIKTKDIYINGTCIEDGATFFQQLGEALMGENAVICDVESLKQYLEQRDFTGEKIVLKWLNYKWMDAWYTDKSLEALEIIKGIKLLNKYNIEIIFYPIATRQVEDISPRQLEEIIGKPARKRIYIDMMQLENVVQEGLNQDNEIQRKRFTQFCDAIVEYKLFFRLKDIIPLIKIATKLNKQYMNYKWQFTIPVFIESILKTNNATQVLREISLNFQEIYESLYSRLLNQNLDKDRVKAVADGYLGKVIYSILRYPFNQEDIQMFVMEINKTSINCRKKVIELLINEMNCNLNRAIYMLKEIQVDQCPQTKLRLILECIGREDYECYSVPEPILDIESGNVAIYYGQSHPIIRLLEEYGEDYSWMLFKKLKTNLQSIQLWKMYYRECMKQQDNKMFINALDLIKQLFDKHQKDEFLWDEIDEKDEYEALILRFRNNIHCIVN